MAAKEEFFVTKIKGWKRNQETHPDCMERKHQKTDEFELHFIPKTYKQFIKDSQINERYFMTGFCLTVLSNPVDSFTKRIEDLFNFSIKKPSNRNTRHYYNIPKKINFQVLKFSFPLGILNPPTITPHNTKRIFINSFSSLLWNRHNTFYNVQHFNFYVDMM